MRVRGIAFDSLRGRPLSDAFVAVVGGGWTTTSDARGRFEFERVPPGTYLLTLQHATLDTLGFPGLSSRVRVTDGREDIRISTPSFPTLWKTVCGNGPAPPDSGIVYGTVRHAMSGAPVGEAIIMVAWHDSVARLGHARADLLNREREALRTAPRRVFTNPKAEPVPIPPSRDPDGARVPLNAVADPGPRFQRVDWSRGGQSDSTGTYAICGVPTSAHDIRVHASAGAATTDSIDVRMDPRVFRSDLHVGPAAPGFEGRGVVVGELIDHAGAPFAHARVIAGGSEGRSNDSGRFVIRNVPAGTREVEVRFLGMMPAHARVDVVAGDTARVTVSVSRIPSLPGMTARATTLGRVMAAEFNTRRKNGLGYVMDSTIIARYPSVTNVLRDVPGLQSSLRGASLTAQVPDGRGGMCTPTVWLDGLEAGYGNLMDLSTRDLVGLEVYIRPLTVPAAYMQQMGEARCGAILAWTSYLFKNR